MEVDRVEVGTGNREEDWQGEQTSAAGSTGLGRWEVPSFPPSPYSFLAASIDRSRWRWLIWLLVNFLDSILFRVVQTETPCAEWLGLLWVVLKIACTWIPSLFWVRSMQLWKRLGGMIVRSDLYFPPEGTVRLHLLCLGDQAQPAALS